MNRHFPDHQVDREVIRNVVRGRKERAVSEHSERIMAVAHQLHIDQCGAFEVEAEKWNRVDDLHRHCDCIKVVSIFEYAERAGHPLVWADQATKENENG